MKKVVITGASGFVGTTLTNAFNELGYEVVAIKREQLKQTDLLTSIIDGCDVVINLAGANIINRWTEEYKKLLYSSRLDTTKALIEAFTKTKNKPDVFISTSAVGIYSNKKEYNEETIEYADDFLGKLCLDWESEALKAESLGIRTAIFRFGIVMGDGGALAKMLTPFKLGLGGTIGNGSQAFSYIHIDDLVEAYKFAINDEKVKGAYNLTAPVPTTNKGMTKALGNSLNRPTLFPIPEFVLNLIFSEGAKVLTDGQSVVPQRLLDEGFVFKFKTIEETIDDLVK
jgi:uncharacterized protein (TIGR01777 family)